MSTHDSSDDSTDPLQIVCDHLDRHSLKHTRDSRGIWWRIDCSNIVLDGSFTLNEAGDVLQIRMAFPLTIPPKSRPSVNELITRANYGLPLGRFEMNLPEGEVRFHVGHLLHDGIIEEEILSSLISSCLRTPARYFPALMQHLHAGHTPEDAIFLAELDYHSEGGEEAEEPARRQPSKPAKLLRKPKTKKASLKKPAKAKKKGPTPPPE